MSVENLVSGQQYFYIQDALTDTKVALEFDIEALLSPFDDVETKLEDIATPYSIYNDLVAAFHHHISVNDEISNGNLSFVAACYCKLTTVYKSFLSFYPDKPSFSMFIVINIYKDTNLAAESIHLFDKPIHGFILDDILCDTAASSRKSH